MRADGVWRAYSNGAGARHWFLARTTTDGRHEEAETSNGRLRWFASSVTADREAAKLNST